MDNAVKLKEHPTDPWLELGGGAMPVLAPRCLGGPDVCVDARMCYLPDGRQAVDFTADLEQALPIRDGEFAGVFAKFVIEHLSWRKVPDFLKECYRVVRPGGKVVLVTANTAAQIQWIRDHPQGWDGKGFFESASCVLFGDQDYPENTHKNYMDGWIITRLLEEAGFTDVQVRSFGDRQTDLVATARKPTGTSLAAAKLVSVSLDGKEVLLGEEQTTTTVATTREEQVAMMEPMVKDLERIANEGGDILDTAEGRRSAFDKHYFNGGGKVGGYAREGMWDFPVHEVTAQHVLWRRPKSALELGCARGYILKRLRDAGVRALGLEISKHCHMTRVTDGIYLRDLCTEEWPLLPYDMEAMGDQRGGFGKFDLCYSIATLEHIPEKFLPHVLSEMKRVADRHLHGIDFGHKDDGFDKTHCTLRPRDWWRTQFSNAGITNYEIVDKEDLERGEFPRGVLEGDNKVKLNVGSYTTMFHHGWVNIDVHDLHAFAGAHGYKYLQHDVRKGLPFGTASVHYIYCSHMLEHLTYRDGLAFLRECRRVIRPDGCMRFSVPDALFLMDAYRRPPCEIGLEEFDEINDGCAAAPTAAGKLWALLHEGHAACYDEATLVRAMSDAGFNARAVGFGNARDGAQIVRETLDMFPCLSLYVEAVPG